MASRTSTSRWGPHAVISGCCERVGFSVIDGLGLNSFGQSNTCSGVRFNRICKRSDGKLWLLGEGSYGKVWKAVWTKPDGAEVDVAMKMTIISPGGGTTASTPERSQSRLRHAVELQTGQRLPRVMQHRH